MQVRGWVPFASTFAAFLSRAYDFVRMAAISPGEHPPVGLARRRLDRRGRPVADGARGHGLVPGDPRLAPSCTRADANQAAKLVAAMADRDGIVVHAHAARQDARAHAGRRGRADRRQPRRAPTATTSTIVACGITLDEALARRPRRSAGEGVSPRVLDLLLDQADRRATRCARRPRRLRRASSPSRTTGPRAGSATPCSRRWPRPTSGRTWSQLAPCARCRRPGTPERAARPGRDRPRAHRGRRPVAGRREALTHRPPSRPAGRGLTPFGGPGLSWPPR